jgi:Ca2+-binding EF-hand superfamily protein
MLHAVNRLYSACAICDRQPKFRKFMKHLAAILLCTILSSSCTSLSPAKQNDLVVRVNQSPSGKISKEEFTDWNIQRIFKLYDRGGKGYVTLQDWQALQGTSRDAQYKRLDANHDGKVTLAEARANPNVRAHLANTFPDIDTNHDGFIDREEAAAYQVKRQSLIP